MKAVIIDDNPQVQSSLAHLLKEVEQQLDLVGTARSVKSGLQLIKDQEPNLLFLDIHLIGGSGFDILKSIDYHKYVVVFITGESNEYKRALEFEAVAYLEKPILRSGLELALVKAQRRYNLLRQSGEGHLNDFFDQVLNNKIPGRLLVSNSTGTHFIEIDDIIRLSVDREYIEIHREEKSKVGVSGKLRRFEEDLADIPYFYRVHNSHIVNLKKVDMLQYDNKLKLYDGSLVPISRSRIKTVKEKLHSL